MESRAPRLGFSLSALIAEAKRRARQRRRLIAVLLVAVAAVVAAFVLGSPGGGSRSGGLSGRVGGTSASSRSVHFGAFVLTVPRGFHQSETRPSIPSHPLTGVTVADYPLTAATSSIYPANGVVLHVESLGRAEIAFARRPPLDLHKLQQLPGKSFGDGTAWTAFLSGGVGGSYAVTVFEGRKASAADRAAVLHALRSIRRAG
jgi:hypothetical protein